MPKPSRVFPSKSQTRRLLVSARQAATAAAELVERRTSGPRPPAAHRKGEGDFVTAVDLAAEDVLRRHLLAAHPDHGFLGEESGGVALAAAEFIWVVDPVDGTSNVTRGLRPFGVSVACLRRGQPVAAAVYCFPEAHLYSAGLGLGAFRGRRRIPRPRPKLDDGAILGVQWLRTSRRLPFLPALLESGARIRNWGCTVVQLCDVAMGRLDANLQEQGKIWDIAAAGLIVEEAGGRFTTWSGQPLFPFTSLDGEVDHPSLASAGITHRRLVDLLSR